MRKNIAIATAGQIFGYRNSLTKEGNQTTSPETTKATNIQSDARCWNRLNSVSLLNNSLRDIIQDFSL